MRIVILLVSLVVLGWFVFCTFFAGYQTGEREVRYQAIRAGAAHWSADAKGRPVFEWGPLDIRDERR